MLHFKQAIVTFEPNHANGILVWIKSKNSICVLLNAKYIDGNWIDNHLWFVFFTNVISLLSQQVDVRKLV